ncbi:TPA: phage tail tape measure protein [Clostridium botulinum]|nr:phage tail tape measure protein [Clostridium botulinum]
MASNVEKRITAKMVLDSSGFNSSLKGVNNELRNAQSQIKLASSGVQVFGKNSERLKSVQEALSKQVELHSKKVDIYSKAIEKSKTKLDDNIKVRDKLKSSLDSANKKYEDAVKTYGKESTEAKKAKEEVDKLTEEHKKAEKAVESNAKKIQNYDTNLNKAKAQMNKAQGELNKLNKELEQGSNKWVQHGEKLKASGEKFKTVGGHVSKAGDKIIKLTAPIAAVGVASAKVGMDFEAQMSKVQAISGATGGDLQALKDKALEMGAKTKFSATESAEALEYMGMAGWKSGDMLKGLPPILNLAIASGGELGETSDIVTDALTAFGLKAQDAGRFSDVLAAASTNANTNVQMMGSTFQTAAPVAGALGYSIQDTSIAIGLMANAGIKGEKAGTALRGGLTNLAKPTDAMAEKMKEYGISITDSNGKVKPFRQTITELRDKLGGLDKATQANVVSTIFGKEAMSGWLSVINASPEDVNKLTKAIDNSKGATQKMADEMSNNAKGKITKALSSLQTAGIKVFEAMAPAIEKGANAVSKLADGFSKLSPETQENIVKFGAFALAGGIATKGIGSLLIGLGNAKIALGTLGLKIGATATTTATAGATMATTGAKAGLLSKALGGVKSAGGLAAGGVTKLAATLGMSVPGLGLAAAGVAAVGFGAYKLHQHMKKDAVPSVDLFDKKLKTNTITMDKYGNRITNVGTKTVNFTNQTKKAVGQFVKDSDKVNKTVFNLCANQTKITAKTAKDVTQQYVNMGNQIKKAEDTKYKQRLDSFKQFLAKNKNMSDLEKKQALQKMQQAHLKQQQQTDKYTKRISQILNNAKNNNRAITTQEQQEINSIQEKMKTNGIKKLSTSEQESKAILSRLKSYGSRITAEQASEVIKNAEKQRQGSVSKANQQYQQTVANIKRMRDEDHSITKDQANKMIAEAERQKRESINKANSHKSGVVGQIRSMNSDVLSNIRTSDGEIMSRWEKLKNWFSNNPIVRWIKSKTSGDSEPQRNWTGSNYFTGGLTYLHDAPGRNSNYELYDLPRGSRIYNHDASQDLVMKTAESVAEKVANRVMKSYQSGNNGGLSLNIENFHNDRKTSIESLMKEMEFYKKQNSLSKGGVYE